MRVGHAHVVSILGQDLLRAITAHVRPSIIFDARDIGRWQTPEYQHQRPLHGCPGHTHPVGGKNILH
jgi:hypothetical protein